MPGPQPLSRRHLLGATIGAGVATSGLAGVAHRATAHAEAPAAPTAISPVDPVDLGPAVTGLSFSNGILIGRELWVGAGRMTPSRVVAYDLDTGQVTKSVELPGIAGVWGMDHVGTELYVATYTPARLIRVDTVAETIVDTVDLAESVAWNVKASPDGHLFVGTYPTAELWEYDPATRAATNHGSMKDGETYLRDLAVNDSTVYCGIGSHPGLVAFDRATGTRTDIMPPEFSDLTFVSVLNLSGDVLLAGTTPQARVAMIDTTDPTRYSIIAVPNDEPYVTSLYGKGNDVWIGTTKSNTIWHATLGSTELTPVATTVSAPYRFGHVDDDHLWVAESNGASILELRTGTLEQLSYLSDKVQPAPQKPMTLHWAAGRVFAPGSGVMAIHPDDGSGITDPSRILTIPTKGEVKDLASTDTDVYAGIYTLAMLGRMAPSADQLSVVARVDQQHQQTRPLDIAIDTEGNRVLFGTEPDYGRWEGAFSWIDLTTLEVTTHRGILVDQSVSAVCPAPGGAWLGGSIRNGYGTEPTRSTAQLAFVDRATGSLGQVLEPLPDADEYIDLRVHGSLVLALTRAGTMVAVDPRSSRVVWTVVVGSRGGRTTRIGNRVFGTDGDRVWSVAVTGHRAPTVDVLYRGLAAQWFGHPTVTGDGESKLYTLKGLNVVRFELG